MMKGIFIMLKGDFYHHERYKSVAGPALAAEFS